MADTIKYVEESDSATVWRWCRRIIIVAVLLAIAIMSGCPPYEVWQQGLKGQGELRRAEQNRQIRIQEAIAHQESAKHLAQSEIERARGVAEANKIIGESLHNNEAYLRYLWVHSIENTKNSVIYVPTEANLPILEAGRLK